MADGTEAAGGIHLRQALQQIQRARVIVNRLHGAAHVPELAEIRPVVGEMCVRWRNGHITPLGQLRRIRAPFPTAQADNHLMAHAVIGGMQTKHGRRFALF